MTADLSDFLAEPPEGYEPPPDDDEGRTAWAITNYPPDARDKIASWAMRRLAAIEAEKERLSDAAEEETARIMRWLADAHRPLERDYAFFRSSLTNYLLAIRDERGEDRDAPKTKSYKLPTGTITGRAGSESINVLDEEKFIEWAKESGYDDLVRTKVEVAKSEIKKHIAVKDGVSIVLDTGERAPFVEVVRGPEKLDAKPSVEG